MNEQLRKRLEEKFGKVGFDRVFPGLELVDAGEGRARLRLPVSETVQNINGALHGGAAATLVDMAGTLAIMTADRDGRAGVSSDLNISWLSPAPRDSVVIAEGTVLKTGRTLAFVQVDLRLEGDGVLVAQGRMTKFLA
jgi:acyl-coenzyme A thioesterase 13